MMFAKIWVSTVMLQFALLNFANAFEVKPEPHSRYRMGAEATLWDRTTGFGVSAGLSISDRLSIVGGLGKQKYSSNDIFILTNRSKLEIESQWYDLLVRYDIPVASSIGFALSGGLEYLRGDIDYTFNAFSSSSSNEKKQFENFALIAKPMVYISGQLSEQMDYQIEGGLIIRNLRDKSYTFQYPDGSDHQENYPPGLMTSVFLAFDILF
jgi:hypothetical protein